MLERLKQWAHFIRRDVHAIYLASRDPRVPWYAKVVAISIALRLANRANANDSTR
jgi:uncharacterized membrane protein YkvA (DUF1232 family)